MPGPACHPDRLTKESIVTVNRTAPTPVQDAAADLLRQAADGLATGRIGWITGSFVGCRGGRCAAGAVTWAAAPREFTGNPFFVGEPHLRAAAVRAVEALADYLVDELAAPRAVIAEDDELNDPDCDYIETVGDWNDEPGRTVDQVVAALRATADRLQHIGGAA